MAKKQLFSILGDSISTFEGCNPEGFTVYYEAERCESSGVRTMQDTWWAQVIEALDGELLANSSFSGSMVEGAGFPAANSAERIAALAKEDKTPDVILAFMGLNDYGWGGPVAQAAGRGNAVPLCLDAAELGEEREPGLAPADAGDKFEAAYEAVLARMCAAYPQAEIWCCTLCPGRVMNRPYSTFTYHLRGIPFDRYNQAIRNAAQRQGCHVADVRAQGFDYEGLEGTHPTARGMQQFAAMVLRAMSAEDPHLAPDRAALDAALSSADHSEDTCVETSCIGCPYVAATGSKWLLECKKGASQQ